MSRFKEILLLFSLLTLYGCQGYKWGSCSTIADYRTICVPYVEGDIDGQLTSAIIKEVMNSGELVYCESGGDLIFYGKMVEVKEENIGFRYLKDRDNVMTEQIVPTESRLTAMIEVEVVDSCKDCTVIGPTRIFATVDYDHDFNRAGLNAFSLGQLNDLDGAEDASYKPLNSALAKKIVNYLISVW